MLNAYEVKLLTEQQRLTNFRTLLVRVEACILDAANHGSDYVNIPCGGLQTDAVNEVCEWLREAGYKESHNRFGIQVSW